MNKPRVMCFDCAIEDKWHWLKEETKQRYACYRMGILHIPEDVVNEAWKQWHGPDLRRRFVSPNYVAGPFSTNRKWRRDFGIK